MAADHFKVITEYCLKGSPEDYLILWNRLANIFCEGPDSKYFKLYFEIGSYILSVTYSLFFNPLKMQKKKKKTFLALKLYKKKKKKAMSFIWPTGHGLPTPILGESTFVCHILYY